MSGGRTVTIVCAFLLIINPIFAKKQKPSNNSSDLAQQHGGIFTLPVLVLGHDGKPLTDLNQGELKLYQGKEELNIESVTRSQGVPRRIGLLIDKTPSFSTFLRKLEWNGNEPGLENLFRTGDSAFVATFSKSPAVLCALTSDLGQVKAAFHRAISEPPTPGGSFIRDAMLWAFDEGLSAQPGLKALIVVSDMEDNASEHSVAEVVVQARRLGIFIYPILPRQLIGTDFRRENATHAFASDTGGVAYAPYDAREFQLVFGSIRLDLDSTYFVSFRSKSVGPSTVKIRCTRKGAKIIAPDRRF